MGPSVIFFPTCIDAFPNQKWGLIFPSRKKDKTQDRTFSRLSFGPFTWSFKALMHAWTYDTQI